MWKPIALATLISGTLDILFATIVTIIYGRAPADMLRTVASGPFPSATQMGTAGAIVGLIVHFGLMAIMAVVFMALVRIRPALLQTPLRTALAYGLVTYVVLDLIVVPLRFPAAFPPKPMSVATQLFAHIVLVGFVFVLVARRTVKNPLQVRPAAA
jgi:uncharacterized membrane protein YagU involved in acid resistance